MRSPQRNAGKSWPHDVCRTCGSRRPISTDLDGDPVCLACRGRELGGYEAETHAALDPLAAAVRYAVQQGMAHPDDLAHRVGEAIAEGQAQRDQLEMSDTQTVAQIEQAIGALVAEDD
jgi:hypothetical protein